MKIGVLSGGNSLEREISFLSAKNVVEALNKLKYENVIIDPANEDFIKKIQEQDFIFNIMHGNDGEDGKFQGLLELLNINFSCSGSEACNILYDKYYFYKIFVDKILMPETILTNKYIEPPFKFPLIFKPRKGGSSQGIFIIHNIQEYKKNISETLKTYGELLIQEYIKGDEFTISYLEKNGKFIMLPPLEIKPKNEFYDWNAKYTENMTDFIIHTDINNEILEQIKNIETALFNVIKLNDMFRIDVIIKENKVFVLEINSVPGMTKYSDLPQSAQAYGLTFTNVIESIIKNHNGGI